MSLKLGSLYARIPVARLPEALLSASSHAPSEVARERFLLAGEGGWSCAFLADEFSHVHRWAQAVSLERSIITVSFFVFEGTWSYEVFENGNHVLGMEFYPHERPRLRGDGARAAMLLGCEAQTFNRYHEAVLAACDDRGGEYPLAFPDDEYPAADEYAFSDFARRVGLPADPMFDEDPVGLDATGNQSSEWTGLNPLVS